MIRTIIIDDEPAAISVLNQLLQRTCNEEVKVIATSDSPEEGKLLIEQHKPDLVFLDIEMPSMTGFELIRSIPDPEFYVVFVTAYDAYAIEAFELSAIDYLLKPVGAEKVIRVVQKIKNDLKKHQSQITIQMQQLENLLKQNSSRDKKIGLGMSDKIVFLNINDILFCAAQGAYSNVHLQDGRNIVTSRTLGEYEELLNNHYFFRIHHSYLINMNHVKEFQRYEGGYVVMENNTKLEVSQRKRKDFLEAMNNLMP